MFPNNYIIGQIPTTVLSNATCKALFIDRYDNLYFVDLGSVKIFNRTNGNVTLFTNSYYDKNFGGIQPLVFPSDLYVDASSRLYALDSSARVIRYLPEQPNNGTFLDDRDHGLGIAQCIFINEADNNAFYTCNSIPTITKFTNDRSNWTIVLDGRMTVDNTSLNGSLSFDSVIVDSLHQQLYISDTKNRRITQWSLSNNTQTGQIIIQFSNTTEPKRIRLDKDKNLYVAVIDQLL
ncbi:hypothetical protein I4U23_021834 [Adineta vaga]|nr:hypothetical protein I4U23_021834 [Adineta vaga]